MITVRQLTLFALAVTAAPAAPPDAYLKRWRDPALNERIERNIERHRKGDAVIEVVDGRGKAVGSARVELRQTSHEFLFGANAFVLGQLGSPEKNRAYEEAFVKLFNFATVPFYWAGTEPTPGELRYAEGSREIWRRPPPDRFLPWAAKHGITLKGHPLLWHAHNPDWLPKDPGELKRLFQKRFREIASRYAGKIAIFDVVNESQTVYKTFPLYAEDRAYVPWTFREVVPLFPKDTVLMINEGPRFNGVPAAESKFFPQLKQLLADGIDIRGIGFQQHYFRRERLDAAMPTVDPVRWLTAYEDYAVFNLPIYITEITVPAAGDDGEALQAEILRDFYRLWFSVSKMAGITYWNFADGTAVEGENEAVSGLVNEQMQPKPAYRALHRLIHEEWATRAEARTSDHGEAVFRGFFGRYQAVVTYEGVSRTFSFTHASGGETRHRFVW
jgi:GH35 family endo-1,4-beta-xylanase